jgi:hypothetical protein
VSAEPFDVFAHGRAQKLERQRQLAEALCRSPDREALESRLHRSGFLIVIVPVFWNVSAPASAGTASHTLVATNTAAKNQTDRRIASSLHRRHRPRGSRSR